MLADALSRIYSNEAIGTVRAQSEYTYHDVIDNNDLNIESITMPVFAGLEAMAMSTSDRVMRSISRAATSAEADTKDFPFGSESRMSPKEGRSTSKKK